MLKRTLKVLILALAVAVLLSGCSLVANVGPAPKSDQQQEVSQSDYGQEQSAESSSESETEQSSQPVEEEQEREYLFTLDEMRAAIVESTWPVDVVIDALRSADLEKVMSLGFMPSGAINTGQNPGVLFSMDVVADGDITQQQAQAMVDSLKSVGAEISSAVMPSADNGYLFTVVATKGNYQISMGYAPEDAGGDGKLVHVAIVPGEKEKTGIFLDLAKLGMKHAAQAWDAVVSAIDAPRVVYSLSLEGGVPKTSFVIYDLKKGELDGLLDSLKSRLDVTVTWINEAMCDIDGHDIVGAVMQINQDTYMFTMDVYR